MHMDRKIMDMDGRIMDMDGRMKQGFTEVTDLTVGTSALLMQAMMGKKGVAYSFKLLERCIRSHGQDCEDLKKTG